MLNRLTNMLIKDSVEKYKNDILVESIILNTNADVIDRCLANKPVCDDLDCIYGKLASVAFDNTDSVDVMKDKLYSAVCC